MNNPAYLPDRLPDTFVEKVEQLYHELELAVMWQRPSFLFAIYRSEAIRKDAEVFLSNRIATLKQRISSILLDDIDDLNALPDIFHNPHARETIFFVRGMVWDCSQNSVNVYREINRYQELFPDNSIRVVFWIMEKEITNLIACAPEYWNFRHRAIDLTGTLQAPEEVALQEVLEDVDVGDRQETQPASSLNQSARTTGSSPMLSPEDAIADNANFLLTLGISNWRENNPQKALEFIQVALDTTKFLPDKWIKAQCYHALALVKTGLNKYEEAIDAYQQAVSLAPESISPWDNLGQLLCKLGRYQEAISTYGKAIEHNPDDPFGWNGLGNAYAEVGLYQNAITAYQKAIKISPDFANAYTGQGDVYANQGAWNEAIASYTQATKLNPRLLKPWVNLGNVLQKKDQYDRAVHAYRNALTVDPTIVNVWNELGNAYLKMNACDEAIEAYQKVIELNPGFGWPYANLAYAHFTTGDYPAAIELYQKSIDLLDDESAKAASWNRLGDAYRQIHDYNKALEAYQTADFLASKKHKTTDRSMARPVSRDARAQQNALEDRSHVNQGGDPRTTVQMRIDPEADLPSRVGQDSGETGRENRDASVQNANYWNSLGHNYLRAGAYDQAITAYKKAMELSPDAIWAYLDNLTLAYYKKGQEKGNNKPGQPLQSEVWDWDDHHGLVTQAGQDNGLNGTDKTGPTAVRPAMVFDNSRTAKVVNQ